MRKSEAVEIIRETLFIDVEEIKKILDKSEAGGEFTNEEDLEEWLNNRFLPNCVLIDEDGYAKMCVDALKILNTTAATDYGSSRQRDMGQLWADMTRGYLGELAFLHFFNKNGINATLGHESGALQEYLPMDIHEIIEVSGLKRKPNINIGIKTTKWNGIWLDIPGDQFKHSDIHVQVKVGAGRDHLFAFFKMLSVFKDKVLKRGEEVGSLTLQESSDLFDRLPTFKKIPAYIAGFVVKDAKYSSLPYDGYKGRKNYTIDVWKGAINSGDLAIIKNTEAPNGSVKFEGIGSFAHDKGYLFNTGSLLWEKENWQNMVFSKV
jgi:hypothetical protein